MFLEWMTAKPPFKSQVHSCLRPSYEFREGAKWNEFSTPGNPQSLHISTVLTCRLGRRLLFCFPMKTRSKVQLRSASERRQQRIKSKPEWYKSQNIPQVGCAQNFLNLTYLMAFKTQEDIYPQFHFHRKRFFFFFAPAVWSELQLFHFYCLNINI